MRIISLVPSQTELLYDLGLGDRVVGITKFCVHPETWYRSKTRIGGTKHLNIEVIRTLRPDLVIANKEENDEAQVRNLCEEFPVWISDVRTLDQSLEMIRNIGSITQSRDRAQNICTEIIEKFSQLAPVPASRVAYLIWNDPMMSVNADTFIHDMLQRCGLINVFSHHDSRYPEFTEGELTDLAPDYILLSSEPFPFREKHIEYFRQLLPGAHVILADGEMFSWYGSRLRFSADYFMRLLNI